MRKIQSKQVIAKIVGCVLLTQGDKVLLRRQRSVDETHKLRGIDSENSTDSTNEVYDVSASGELTSYEEAVKMAQRIACDSLDVEVELGQFKLIHVRHSPERQELSLFFWAKRYAGTPRICRPEEGSELRWCQLNELPENIVPRLAKVLYYWQRNVLYSDTAD